MAIRIRVVTPITTAGFRTIEDAARLESEDVKVSFVNIDTGPASIECDYEIMLAQPGTIAKIVEAERQGADAVVIDCMGDPGLSGARECVSIPVLGPMQTAMGVAAMMGHRFSVVTVTRPHRTDDRDPGGGLWNDFQARFGACGRNSGFGARGGSGRNQARPDRGGAQGRRRGRRRLHHFGCTGMLGCADAVHAGLREAGLDVPVIDPVPTAINVAAALVRSRLTHSKHAYQPPPRKNVVGYEAIGIGVRARQAAE
jgi:allantoin racemase